MLNIRRYRNELNNLCEPLGGGMESAMKKDKKKCPCQKKTSIGGQALMEGIMMRGPQVTAMAVRNPQGEIVVEKFPTVGKNRSKFFKLPIIRGVVNYIDSMVFGTKCLMRSAEIAGLEDAEQEMKREKEAKKAKKKKDSLCENNEKSENISGEEITDDAAKEVGGESLLGDDIDNSESKASKENKEKNKKDDDGIGVLLTATMIIGIVIGLVFAVAMFIVFPSYLYKWLSYLIPALKPDNDIAASFVKSAFEGVIKIALLVGYMSLISLMKDIRRTYMFHGAEHKTIFCYENNLELTVENVRMQKRFHPRCGTSFLILMLLVSIFISFFIDPICISLVGYVLPTIYRVIVRLLLLPIVVGIGYELIKLAGRYDNLFTRIISAPGVWLQHLTVFEPDDSMIECAITAVKEVIPNDNSDNW